MEEQRKLYRHYMSKMDRVFPRISQMALADYLAFGVPPGNFLTAVLENNLRDAAGSADPANRYLIWRYVRWLAHNAPAISWGYPGATYDWYERLYHDRKKAE